MKAIEITEKEFFNIKAQHYDADNIMVAFNNDKAERVVCVVDVTYSHECYQIPIIGATHFAEPAKFFKMVSNV